ncbi:TonB-dependent receptor [Prevotella sp. tf2-5]|uniref:SusC/RagA family TonB-linked outer membrane protein n=1 Tax=Prevotella sp. tf2-5 TaxID=1761889 RepID=UPI0008DEEF51|nr:TonB-dependent receptor [Prevotella sp. tf2-5]SFO64207.1 TonB-linked outer membrane protein, SusC/RagA family [Prevotella sp. tf2-5]
MNKKFIISLCLSLVMSLFSLSALAQNQTVSGTVLDEAGEPVIGATVTVAGTKTATITDFDGNYKITIPKGGKVTISYIGYLTQTVTPGGTVKLEEDKQSLEEVVVVGYGTQKKAHLTGSVATVDMNDVQDLANGGLASSLSGLVNGLSVSGGDARPGENATMRIRDVNSLGEIGSNAQSPLYVIDGYIYPNDVKVGSTYHNLGEEAFNNLDPSEVESISVLKDASAAVYGSRAANGVILVTTKKGKLGAPTISYSGTFGFTNEVSRAKMLSAYDYGRLYNSVIAADPTNTSLNHTTALFQADELAAMRNLNYDLLDKYWKTGFTQRHAVNVSGATEKVNYFAGISYFSQDGNLGKLDYNRWNYRAGVDVKISEWLGANLTVSGDYGTKDKPLLKVGGTNSEKDYNLMLTRPRYMPEYVGDYPVPSYGPSNGARVQNQNYHFATLQDNGDFSESKTSTINISGSINYDFGWSKILKGLKVKFSYSKSINTDKTNEFGTAYTLYTMQRRYGSGQHLYTPTAGDDPTFNYLDYSNFNPIEYANGNYSSRQMVRTDNYQMNLTFNYNRTFGKHTVGALFSIEKSETESEYNLSQANEPYSFSTHQSNSTKGDQSLQFNRAESGTLSYIGRLNYSYADRYLFEFLLRSDASTKFAPENYWGTFPALSAGWVVSEEPWFQNVKWLKWIDFLKIRASWGITGRDNLTPWQWLQIYTLDKNKSIVFGEGTNLDPSKNTRISINKNTSAVNRDVHWDKSYKTNIGFDLQVLNRRLGINVDYYKERNREMLMNLAQNVPSTVGTQSASTNLGEMNSWGWEISLNWRDKIGKDFKYKVGLNTGYHDNEVLVMDFEDDYIYRQILPGGRTDIGTWGMQCIGMFRSFQDIEEYFAKYNITTYMGMTKDQVRPGMLIYKDVRGAYNQETKTYEGPDGVVDANNDQVCLSNRSNPYGFTINMNAEWKGISLTAQMGASWGGYTLIPAEARGVASGSNIEFYNMPSFWNPDNMYAYQDVEDGSGNIVVKENRNAHYPNLAYGVNSNASSFWRVSAATVRLSRLTLAYTIPNKLYKSVGIKNIRVNITGQNLLNFYNPYPDGFMSPLAGAYGKYPNLRKWTIGVNLSF